MAKLDKRNDEEEITTTPEKNEVEPQVEPLSPQVRPSLPFPQRFKKQRLDRQFQKFLEVFKKLHTNIPFAEALEQMSSYVKFMKDMLSKKRRLWEYEMVALTEECSAILQHKSLIYLALLRINFVALCDLGASINLMPLSNYKKLGLGEAHPTIVTLQLVDGTLDYPRGVVEDVLVKVDKFIFPADFIILDYEEDKDVPIILGRPFLATGRAIIDVQQGELTMKVQDQEVTFNVFKAMIS